MVSEKLGLKEKDRSDRFPLDASRLATAFAKFASDANCPMSEHDTTPYGAERLTWNAPCRANGEECTLTLVAEAGRGREGGWIGKTTLTLRSASEGVVISFVQYFARDAPGDTPWVGLLAYDGAEAGPGNFPLLIPVSL